MSLRTDRFLVVCCAVLLALSVLQVLVAAIQVNGFYDLPAYLGATRQLFSGGNPYAQEYANNTTSVNYQYPPGAALWLALLVMVPSQLITVVFSMVSMGVFLAALWLTFALVEENQPPLWHKLLMIALLAQTFPLKLTIMLGQVNTIVLFLLISSLYLLKKQKYTVSSLLMSGAITIKIIPIICIGIALLRRQYRWAFTTLGFVVVVNALFFTAGIHYLQVILPGLLQGKPAIADPLNQSLVTLMYRLQLGDAAPVFAVGILLLLGVLLYRRTDRQPIWIQCIAFLPLMVLVAANSWQHHLILMYPFLLIFVRKWRWFLPLWLLLAIRPSYILLLQPTVSWLWSYQTIGLLILMISYLIHLRGDMKESE